MGSFSDEHYLVGGWPTPLKNDGVRQLGWDDEIPNWMESHKSHVPNHQPVMINDQHLDKYLWTIWDYPIFRPNHIPRTVGEVLLQVQ